MSITGAANAAKPAAAPAARGVAQVDPCMQKATETFVKLARAIDVTLGEIKRTSAASDADSTYTSRVSQKGVDGFDMTLTYSGNGPPELWPCQLTGINTAK